MRKITKRTMALLLSLCLIFTLLSTAALATEGGKTVVDRPAVGTVTPAAAPNSATILTSQTSWSGVYVATTASLTNVTVSGNTTVYIPLGVTLTITGSNGTDGYSGSTDNTGVSGATPSNTYCAKNGITINSGTLTFTGPGNLIVTGGIGGDGSNRTQSSTGSQNWGAGGGRGGDGVYVASGATLKFAETFTGTATIMGGMGGRGGDGADAAGTVSDSGTATRTFTMPEMTKTSTAGSGGQGGDAGYGIANNGAVIFSQDSANDTLLNDGAYTTGSVNIKGGVGAIGGTGGALHSGTSQDLTSVADPGF